MQRLTTFFLGFFAFTLFVGCGSPASKLIGKWRADFASPLPENATIEDRIKHGVMSQFKVDADFASDGQLKMVFGPSEKAGTWKYISTDNQTMIVELRVDGEKESRLERLTFLDNDTIQWKPPGGTDEMIPKFKRVVAETKK